MNAAVTYDSARARALLSAGAFRAVLREGAVHAGEQWVAEYLPKRFDSGYAPQLGYRLKGTRSMWAARRGLPATYLERKQAYAGHQLPLVYTGRLRERVYRQVRVTATAPAGNIRLTIGFGRLPVKNRDGQVRELPANSVVRRTLTALTPVETQFVASQLVAYLGARFAAISAPVKSAKRLPPAPQAQSEEAIRAREQLLLLQRGAGAEVAAIGARLRERVLRRLGLWEQWRQQSGGAAPVGGVARSPAERRHAHRLAQRAYYIRNRARILRLRRMKRAAGRAASRRYYLAYRTS